MSDLGEMIQRLRQDLQEPNIADSSTVNPKEEYAQANLAIIDSVREEQHQEFWFNVGNSSFATVDDQESYRKTTNELPLDFLTLLSENLYMEIRQQPEQVWRLPRLTSDRYDYQQAVFTTKSFPIYYRFWNEQIWLTPRPNAVHNIRYRYLRDLGVPRERWDGSVWLFDHSTWGGGEIAKAWQEDADGGPSFVDVTAGINDETLADVLPFPAGAGGNDSISLGFAIKPTSLTIKTAIAATGPVFPPGVTWEYSTGNGNWAGLAGVVDGSVGFSVQGEAELTFTDPGTAWKRDVVNASDLLFWIRGRRDGGAVTIDPVLSQITAPTASPWMNEAERLIRLRSAYLFCQGYLKDPERAMMYLQRALEARQDLQQRQQDMHQPAQVEGWI